MSAKPEPRPRWVLTVEAQPSPDGAPAIVRLRRALKCLLRVFGLRCLSAAWAVADNPDVRRGSDEPGLTCWRRASITPNRWEQTSFSQPRAAPAGQRVPARRGWHALALVISLNGQRRDPTATQPEPPAKEGSATTWQRGQGGSSFTNSVPRGTESPRPYSIGRGLFARRVEWVSMRAHSCARRG
jgi:hypothetical protein